YSSLPCSECGGAKERTYACDCVPLPTSPPERWAEAASGVVLSLGAARIWIRNAIADGFVPLDRDRLVHTPTHLDIRYGRCAPHGRIPPPTSPPEPLLILSGMRPE